MPFRIRVGGGRAGVGRMYFRGGFGSRDFLGVKLLVLMDISDGRALVGVVVVVVGAAAVGGGGAEERGGAVGGWGAEEAVEVVVG